MVRKSGTSTRSFSQSLFVSLFAVFIFVLTLQFIDSVFVVVTDDWEEQLLAKAEQLVAEVEQLAAVLIIGVPAVVAADEGVVAGAEESVLRLPPKTPPDNDVAVVAIELAGAVETANC